MKEFAIICSFENGEQSVHYVKGTKADAIEEAKDSKRISGAWAVTVAEVKAFIGLDDDMTEY